MFPYIVLLFVVFYLSKQYKRNDNALFLLFVFMSLFIGLRKDVGTDYENYTMIYDSDTHFLEIGFQLIVQWLNSHGLPPYTLFLTFAVITYGFIFAGIYKQENIEKFPTAFLLSVNTMTFICNGIRQAAAVAIFFFASRFIISRKWYIYFPLILFAFLFHKSILICLPLYFLKDFHLPKKTYVIIYMISFVFVTMDLQSIMQPLMPLLEDNERYANYMYSDRYTSGYFSLGVFAELLNYIILLWLSLRNDVEKKHPLWFNFFFFVIVLFNMRIASPLFNRVQVTFSWFITILMPIALMYEQNLSLRKKLIIWFIFSIAATSIKYIFFTPISRLYPYQFVF